MCPVGLNTLVIPRRSGLDNDKQQPYVYLTCGHVQGHHDWGQEKDSNGRTCPMCLKVRDNFIYLYVSSSFTKAVLQVVGQVF